MDVKEEVEEVKVADTEFKRVNGEICRRVFEMEKTSYNKDPLKSSARIQAIKRIVEEEVK